MAEFFQKISKAALFDDYAKVFDWLFDDSRFSSSSWTAVKKSEFTNKVKESIAFGTDSFEAKGEKNSYPEFSNPRSRKKRPFAVFTVKGSKGESFVRHVRNGFAHGNVEWYKADKSVFIQIKDFYNKKQSAFIAIPLDGLLAMYEAYRSIEESK